MTAGVERKRPPPPPLKSELRLELEETEWLPKMRRVEVVEEEEEVETTSAGIASRLVLVCKVKE